MTMKRNALILLFVLTVTFAVFSEAVSFDFTNWDDPTHVTDNFRVRSLAWNNITRIFRSTLQRTYIPLTTLSFALEYRFFGYRPFFYHLDNILLHLMVTGLVFLFVLKCGFSSRAAAVAALIFGVHPMHVESVAWITERKDVLYAVFYMAAVIFYLDYLRKRTPPPYLGALACGLLSMLAKPMAVSLPLILLLCDWFTRRPINRDAWRDKIPFFVYIIPIAWITYHLQMRLPGREPGEAALIWLWTFSFYPTKFFLPLKLLPIYPLPQPVSLMNPVYAGSIGFTMFVIWFFRKFKNHRTMIFAGLFYLASIFFLLRFDELLDAHVVADRFMYLPSVGICLLLGSLTDQGLSRLAYRARAFGYAGLIVLLSVMSLKTILQVRVWKNSATLWRYVIKYNPGEATAHHNLGMVYAKAHQYDTAIRHYNEAVRLDPDYAQAYNNLGNAYYANGDNIRAFWYFSEALRLFPRYAQAYNNRGNLFAQKNHYRQALENYTAAITFAVGDPLPYYNRGNLLTALRNYQQAIWDFTKAIEINPQYSLAYNNRGIIYYRLGMMEKAGEDFEMAFKLDPSNATAYFNRNLVAQKKSGPHGKDNKGKTKD